MSHYKKALEEGNKEYGEMFETQTIKTWSIIELRKKSESYLTQFAEKIRQAVAEDILNWELEKVHHSQQKLLDGFAHPKDCEICAREQLTKE